MKYFLILLIITPLLSFSQEEGTTLEEYRYCTKGYQMQIESGLDPVKNGYEIKKLYAFEHELRTVNFVGLIEKSSLNLKAIILILSEDNLNITKTFCLPNEYTHSKIDEMYQESLMSLSSPHLNLVLLALSKYTHFINNQLPEEELDIDNSPSTKITVSSDIGGGLAGRDAKFRSLPNNDSQLGEIMIKVCIAPNGCVIQVRYSKIGSTISDDELVFLALKAAKKFKFQENPNAPDKQCGTITFKFSPK
jgi:hypothetical protein